MIHKRLCWFGLAVGLFLGLLAGCGKSPTDSKPSDPRSQTPDFRPQTLDPAASSLRLHWLGKKRLATESNATNFMDIWNLPESARLEAQTLDKLSTAPWRLLKAATPLSNAPVALLRPLLDDLVQEESYLEVVTATNQPAELVLAIRLSAERAALWQTNLPIIFRSFSAPAGEKVAPPDEVSPGRGELPNNSNSSATTLNFQLSTFNFQLAISRSNDWTLLSGTTGTNNALLANFHQRLARTQIPYLPRATNYLVETEGNLSSVNEAFGLGRSLPVGIRAFKLVVFGDGDNLRTRGWLDFANPLNMPLDPWQVPTNLIQQPLVGFSALRGIRPWLESLDFWKEKQLGVAPNQAFFWSQKSAPWLHFFAVRSPDANRQFLALKDYVLETVNPALAPNRTGDFGWLTNDARVVWKGVPFCSPSFELRGNLILGGFVGNSISNRPMPGELLQQLQNGTNLVYYDWEATGPQVTAWTQISQLMRMAFAYAQMSIKEPGLPWLNNVGPNLGFSATTLTLEGDRRLVFARASTLGLNSIELELFADWLDSPEFPSGLHTFAAPREYVADRTRPRR